MKKIKAAYLLDSKIGKSRTLNSMDNKNYDIPDNFILEMTNCQPESNLVQ